MYCIQSVYTVYKVHILYTKCTYHIGLQSVFKAQKQNRVPILFLSTIVTQMYLVHKNSADSTPYKLFIILHELKKHLKAMILFYVRVTYLGYTLWTGSIL